VVGHEKVTQSLPKAGLSVRPHKAWMTASNGAPVSTPSFR